MKTILKILGFVFRFLKWKKWKEKAENLEQRLRDEQEAREAENHINEEVNNVTRPDGGSDDDLLNSEGRNRK